MSKDAWKRFGVEGYTHYDIQYPGYKYNMTDIQAALGIHQLKKIDEWLSRREKIWEYYMDILEGVSSQLPSVKNSDFVHARHLFTILIGKGGLNRDQFLGQLHEHGIGGGVHYRALHGMSYYKKTYGFLENDFENAFAIGEATASIPLYPALTDLQVEYVAKTTKAILS
jgi:dTDP-4-amino-4,6-dideoxygalactose transaminase